jgi:hypothetical protein
MTPEEILSLMIKWNSAGFDDRRAHMVNYWHEPDGHSYSINGFCLLRVPGQFGISDADMPKGRSVFDWDKLEEALIDEADYKTISAEKLKKVAADNPCYFCAPDTETKKTRIECFECGGDGEIKCSCCGHEEECENCDGTGYIEEARYKTSECPNCHGTGIGSFPPPIAIGKHVYGAVIIAYLNNNLENLRFYPDLCDDGILPFSFHGGRGVVQKCRE